MASRITIKDLRPAVERLNRMTGNPTEPYTRKDDGSFVCNIGNYHLSQAYGGYQVQQMLTDGGGVTTPITCGHVPARECYETLHAFIRGYEQARRDQEQQQIKAA